MTLMQRAVFRRRSLRNGPWTDRLRRVLCRRNDHCPVFAEPDRSAFFQPVQDRHKLHRDRHDDPESGGHCVFHCHGGECCRNSAGLDRAASGNHSEPRSNFPTDRVVGGGVLVFLGNETFSV